MQKDKLAESKKLEDALRLMPTKIVEGQEEERKRVSKELHDGISQMLASIKYRVAAFGETGATDPGAFRGCAEAVSSDLDKTIDEVKRISHALHPKVLDDLGFAAAVRNLCDESGGRFRFRVEIDLAALPEKLSRDIELGAFRIIQEALNNIEKHASARTVRIDASRVGDSTYLAISDDGRGFKTDAPPRSPGGRSGLGLTTMKERAILMGSIVDVHSSVPGGTRITLKIPAQF